MSTLRLKTPEAYVPLLERSRYKAAYGGRGSAKSHFFAELLLERSLTDQPLRAVCVREVQNTIKESVKRLLEDKIKHYELGAHFVIKQSEIETPGGGIIIFRGMQHYNADNIKSLEGYKICWVEEAQTFSDTSLELLRPTIRAPESELWFSWNPRLATDPVDRLFRGPAGPPPNSIVVPVSWRDNPWFPDVLRTELEWAAKNNPEKYQHVWEGAYQERSEAQVFHNWRIESFETPEDARFYFGGDWGFAQNPSTLIRCFIIGRKLFVDYEVYKVGVEIDYLPFLFAGTRDIKLRALNVDAYKTLPAEAKDRWEGIPGAREWTIIADSARPETISHMQRHGFERIEPATKGPGSVEEGVEFLRNFEIIIHPRCVNTAAEFGAYRYKVDRITGDVLPKLEDKNNHCIDATRYAIERVRRGDFGLLFSGTANIKDLEAERDALLREVLGR